MVSFTQWNCISQVSLQKCIEQEVEIALNSTNESKLFENEELVMLANFYNGAKEMKLAVLHKEDYASFMRDKQENQPNGYVVIDKLILLVYGDSLDLELRILGNDFKFLNDTKRQEYKEVTASDDWYQSRVIAGRCLYIAALAGHQPARKASFPAHSAQHTSGCHSCLDCPRYDTAAFAESFMGLRSHIFYFHYQ